VMKPGFYNDHSQQQLTAARAAEPLSLKAAQLVPVPQGGPVRILDCGSSQGRNSVLALTGLLQQLQARLQGTSNPPDAGVPEQQVEVEVLFEDLPSNDFNSLMSAITDATSGLPAQMTHTPSPSTSSSSSQGPATPLSIYPRCIGRSFYERLAPRDTLHMVTAFTCLHWIPAKPCAPPDTPIPYLSEAAGVVEAYEGAFAAGFARWGPAAGRAPCESCRWCDRSTITAVHSVPHELCICNSAPTCICQTQWVLWVLVLTLQACPHPCKALWQTFLHTLHHLSRETQFACQFV
jgi:hypothetical protein